MPHKNDKITAMNARENAIHETTGNLKSRNLDIDDSMRAITSARILPRNEAMPIAIALHEIEVAMPHGKNMFTSNARKHVNFVQLEYSIKPSDFPEYSSIIE